MIQTESFAIVIYIIISNEYDYETKYKLPDLLGLHVSLGYKYPLQPILTP